MAIYCTDIETTGLLHQLKKQDNPMLHNFGAIDPKTGEEILFSRSKNNLSELQDWLNEGHTLVMHNGICYDGEALTYLGYDLSNNEIIDTLPLSWYLNPTKPKHGLEAWGEEFGVPKPPVYDWINGDPKVYDHRVMEDCKIQVKLWELQCKQLNNIYDTLDGKKRLIDYLMFKMELQRIQQTYKWKLDKPAAEKLQETLEAELEQRKIPQINVKNSGGKVCPSVKILIEKYPDKGLDNLEGLGILSHRLSIVKGFLKNVDEEGYIQASCSGFTNTLRLKHSILVNFPSTRVAWGKEIRSLLTTPQGYKNIGSDLSSLEDRCKHHFQWKFDPEYVKMQMADDFDPHLTVAQMGGLMTASQVEEHKSGVKDWGHVRHLGKGGNYALTCSAYKTH